MPSRFQSAPYTQLNLGVNLRGMTGGLDMRIGEAHDAVDIMPREDGAIAKHWGYERLNTSALTGRPVGIKGFTYKGKNNDTGGGDTVRPGNYGIADTGNDFTRRGALYTGAIVLTDSTFYRWEPATQAFVSVSLPANHTVSLHPKPSFIVYNNNVYICGYATSSSSSGNMRYDPTDEVLYAIGWERIPAAATVAASAGTEDLIEGAVYIYGVAYLDIYTGEESPVIESAPFTATSTGEATLTLTAYSEATEARHFNTAAVGTDRDVGFVIYRSEADNTKLNFLAVAQPGTATLVDQGMATDASIHPYYVYKTSGVDVGAPLAAAAAIPDEPDFNFWTLFQDQFYGVSQGRDYAGRVQPELRPTNANRIYWNDFKTENSYVERWSATGYRELPLPEGENLTSIGVTNSHLIPFTQKGAYAMSVIPNYQTGTISRIANRLPWNVGCVGAKGHATVNGWLYFLSERGPYRFRPGMDPQWIGKNLLPMFIDHTSGLCQLNAGMMAEAEVKYDSDANMVRFVFACGASDVLNRNISYWAEADTLLPAPYYGWYFASPEAQCFDMAVGFGPLQADGSPPDPLTRSERFIFGDNDGYINSYEPRSTRAGLPSGNLATGAVVSSTSTVLTATVVGNPLFTQDDGLTGMRLEVEHSDGTIEIRTIASNTATTITVVNAFVVTPTSADLWYVAGIPAFWRSWVDHLGHPHDRKTMLHLYLTYGNTDVAAGNPVIDVTVLSGDRGLTEVRSRTARLDDWNEKILISRTGLYFTYEIANTRPDEMFYLVCLEPEFAIHGIKRSE